MDPNSVPLTEDRRFRNASGPPGAIALQHASLLTLQQRQARRSSRVTLSSTEHPQEESAGFGLRHYALKEPGLSLQAVRGVLSGSVHSTEPREEETALQNQRVPGKPEPRSSQCMPQPEQTTGRFRTSRARVEHRAAYPCSFREAHSRGSNACGRIAFAKNYRTAFVQEPHANADNLKCATQKHMSTGLRSWQPAK